MLMCNTHKLEIIEKMLQLSFESTIKQKTTDDCSIVIMYKLEGITQTWNQLPNEQLLNLFELDDNVSIDFRNYIAILKLLTKRNCSLDGMYTWFHINKKEKKEMLRRQLQRLQRLQLIAEVEENVFSLFIN